MKAQPMAHDILKQHGYSVVSDMERWRWVVGFEGFYEVSSLGRIRSVDRVITHSGRWGLYSRMMHGCIIACGEDGGGYKMFMASRPGVGAKMRKVHICVAQAFIGDRPDGMFVCHNNGNNKDNRLENLRYDTPSGNSLDSINHGATQIGNAHHNCKIPDEYINIIRSKSISISEAAEMFSVSKKYISSIRSGKDRSKYV